MGVLIKNELIKLFGRKSSWIMQIVLVIGMFGMAFMMLKSNESMQKYFQGEGQLEFKGGMTAYQMADGTLISQDQFWNQEGGREGEFNEVSLTLDETISLLESSVQMYKSQPKKYDKQMIKLAEKELAFYQAYKDKGEVPQNPNKGTTSAGFFSSYGQIYVLPTLFAVIIASMIIAAEFSGGTIKLLLTRPYSRMQILWSKYIVTIFYGLLTSIVMAVSAFAFSFILPNQSLTVPLSSEMGTKTGLMLAGQLFASNSLLMLLYITIAFFFSAVIRSQALAVGVGMGVLFSGSILGQILPNFIEKYDWLKWIIFNLLGLNNQVLDTNYLTGGNLSISATVVGIIVYIVLIYTATLAIFNKRDVALS